MSHDPRRLPGDPMVPYESVPWHAAACKGINTDLFYLPTSEAMGINPKLRAMCATCPILEECREYAIWHEWDGLWGGLAAHERGRLRAQLRKPRRAA